MSLAERRRGKARPDTAWKRGDEAEPSLPSGLRCRTGPLLLLDKLLARTNLLAASGNQPCARCLYRLQTPAEKWKLKAAEEVKRGTLITPMCYI